MDEAGFYGDVGEGAVAIVFVEMGAGFLASGKAFEAGAVDEEDVEPAVVVVVVKSYAAAGGFEEVFVFVFTAEDGFGVEAGFFGDVYEVYAERRSCYGWSRGRRTRGSGRLASLTGKCGCCVSLRGAGEGKNIFEREDGRGAAERLEKSAA